MTSLPSSPEAQFRLQKTHQDTRRSVQTALSALLTVLLARSQAVSSQERTRHSLSATQKSRGRAEHRSRSSAGGLDHQRRIRPFLPQELPSPCTKVEPGNYPAFRVNETVGNEDALEGAQGRTAIPLFVLALEDHWSVGLDAARVFFSRSPVACDQVGELSVIRPFEDSRAREPKTGGLQLQAVRRGVQGYGETDHTPIVTSCCEDGHDRRPVKYW